MSESNILQLFENARNNGNMDTDTQQMIFRELANVWSCFPLNGNEFVRIHNIENPDVAKAPRGGGWNKGCTERITMTDFNTDLIGIACGPYNGILVLDIDDEEKFNAYCDERGLIVPNSFKVKTGNGYHLYYQYPDDGNRYGNRSFNPDGFAIRGMGEFVVAPGSLHPNGNYYDIVDFNEVRFEEAPQWLLDLALSLNTNPDLGVPEDDKQEDTNLPVLRIEQAPVPILEPILEALPENIRTLIKEGKPVGERSEAIQAVLVSLVNRNFTDVDIFRIFATYKIGERCNEKGPNYLSEELARAKDFVKNNPPALIPDEKKKAINLEAEAEKILSGYDFFKDEEEKIYCRINLNGNIRFLPIDSNEFFGFLKKEVKNQCGVSMKHSMFNEMLYSLKADLSLYNQLAYIDSMKRFYQIQGKLWYDSGRDDMMVYEITSDGVNLIPQPEILLKRKGTTKVDVDTNQHGL